MLLSLMKLLPRLGVLWGQPPGPPHRGTGPWGGKFRPQPGPRSSQRGPHCHGGAKGREQEGVRVLGKGP